MATGCGPTSDGAPSASSGQVKATATSTPLSPYAAARVADQVSFGATPALVAELSKTGLAAWVDQQLAMPVTRIESPPWVIDYDRNNRVAETSAGNFVTEAVMQRMLTTSDQLRLRVTWALYQFIPTNSSGNDPYARVEHYNLLQRYAFGNYGDFLYELSIHPAMGQFLNNNTNRPKTKSCPQCAPNENYARELLQLFSVGVVQLNADGTTVRDAQGKALETYTQKDVEELARALTGWQYAPSARPLANTNGTNAGELMVPEASPELHDLGAKNVMGTLFAAGADAPTDLRTAITLLMAHPNIAPFVSLRLIQHLVTSNPSPQYVGRVAAVFRNNGKGVTGDMKAVVRAVLLDAEARRGDQAGSDLAQFGKLREPLLWYTAALRGLGCTAPLHWIDTNNGTTGTATPQSQNPTGAPSVFGFYLPTDRAPGSNLLAPEQKLLTTPELSSRLGGLHWELINPDNPARPGNFTNSGCNVGELARALASSPKAFVDLVSARWFRGAMPPTLRNTLMAIASGQADWATPEDGALTLLQFALTSPYFGVMK